jgi:NADH:ubiquinone oxidoreductase subunit 6 (subunit J)
LSIPEADSQRRPAKPVHVTLFGVFSIIFGAVVTFAVLALAAITNVTQADPLYPLFAFTSIGFFVSGIGFLQGKRWGWVGSILVYGGAFGASVAEAFLRILVTGIFIEPIILVYLLVPSVRAYFFRSPELALGATQKEINPLDGSRPIAGPERNRLHIGNRANEILTGSLMLVIISVVPAVAVSVHTVSVTGITLNIYPGNPDNPWFGSSRTLSGSVFTWGHGQTGFRFSLVNYDLWQAHSIDSISLKTQGFVLYAPPTPISVPALGGVALSMRLQAPDYNYYGPVTMEIQTS